jgi:hypothetical protein
MNNKILLLLSSSLLPLSLNAKAATTLVEKRIASDKAPRIQSLAITENNTIWASGTKGNVVVSVDNGNSWQEKTVLNSEELQFRDIWASQNTVYLLAAGEGENSKIYRSNDNGERWTLQYVMKNPKGFINCFDFWDKNNGIIFGDSIDEKVFMLHTTDGGENWLRLNSAPLSQEGGEGGFSASGSCVRIGDDQQVWVSTGATKAPRLLRSSNKGKSWSSTPLPYPKGKTAGIFSAIPNSQWTFGGRMENPVVTGYHLSNQQWQPAKNIGLKGAIYGSDSYLTNIVVVNPDGVAISTDNGKHWEKISNDAYWVVEFDHKGTAWLAGPKGRISNLTLGNDK